MKDHQSKNYIQQKKVLLRERKRHTARRVVSTPSVVLPGYPPPILTWPGGGTRSGPPRGGVPGQVPPRGVPSQVSPPARVPPRCPMAFWEMLQSIMGYGYPPPRCGQTNKVKLLPSRRTTYAGGKNQFLYMYLYFKGFRECRLLYFNQNCHKIQQLITPCSSFEIL